MKGLEKLPTSDELLHAYNQLQSPGNSISSFDLALWSQWTRLDPRLAEILVDWMERNWRTLPPALLHEALLRQPWPQVFGVLLEHTAVRLKNSQVRKQFHLWYQCTMLDVEPSSGGQFYIGLRKFSGQEMRKDSELSLRAYLKWGYLGRDLIQNKSSKQVRTLIPRKSRLGVLEEMMRTHSRFQVKDYLEVLEGKIHPRQAERDLRNHPKLRAIGKTRSRWFIVR